MNVFDQVKNLDMPPVVVAEISANHNGSIERAKSIIKAAAEAGAHAVKLQTYTADTMTIDSPLPDFEISDSKSLWYGRKLYDLYQEAHTPWSWHPQLFDYARSLGMDIFSTPFDASAVDFLETMEPSCYKIASFEATDLDLLTKVAKTQRPVILSSGMCTALELSEALTTLRAANCKEIIVLKCTSAYPAPIFDMNLSAIPEIKAKYLVEVGLSDHTLTNTSATVAVSLGARLIEKHFTLNRKDGGPDAVFSLEPKELSDLVQITKEAWQSLGNSELLTMSSEQESKAFRRSIYVVKDIKAQDILTEENIRVIRTGFGLAPKFYNQVLGSRAKQDLVKGTAISFELIDCKGT